MAERKIHLIREGGNGLLYSWCYKPYVKVAPHVTNKYEEMTCGNCKKAYRASEKTLRRSIDSW